MFFLRTIFSATFDDLACPARWFGQAFVLMDASHPTPRRLAEEYLEIFFHTHRFERLFEICAPDLRFRGPFFSGDSVQEYVESLRHGPPLDCGYRLLYEFYDAQHAHLVYEFIKGSLTTIMSQTFEIAEDRITHIRLIFDTAPFGDSAS